jgi:uncharacterized membrane-anchored protein YhcB (DUF1043 family)
MTNTLAQADWVGVVDRAAGMNDRWMFVAALVLLGLLAAAVARYFVKQYERLQAEHQQVLATLMGRQEERQTELVRVVAANTEALRAVSQELRWCKERNLASGSGHA